MRPNATHVDDCVYCSVDGDQSMTPVEAEALATKLLAAARAARGDFDIESDPYCQPPIATSSVGAGLIRVDFPDGSPNGRVEVLSPREARVLIGRLLVTLGAV